MKDKLIIKNEKDCSIRKILSKFAAKCEILKCFASLYFEYILNMNVLDLSEQEIIRRNSLQELRDMGIDPYPAAEYPTDAFSTDIKANFKDDEKREVCIAGRLMSRRVMGKASFAEIQDSKGRIQVYVTRDDITKSTKCYNKHNKCTKIGMCKFHVCHLIYPSKAKSS